MKYKIEKNIPLPAQTLRELAKQMEPGDSIGGLNKTEYATVYDVSRSMKFTITSRWENGGKNVRVWRVPENYKKHEVRR